MTRTGTQSVEPNVADAVNSWLKKYKIDYKLEQESLNSEIDKALEELHLSAVGLVSSDTQLKLGKLIGAKILISGSLFETSGKKYAVAKLIGTLKDIFCP